MYCEGVLCDPCHTNRVEKRIAEFDGDHEYMAHAVCPHCGCVEADSWDMTEGEQQCDDCGRDYVLERIVDVSYSTTKVEKRGASS